MFSVESAINPCKGGINAPPKIIMMSKEEACDVYFPNPAMESEKMQGHMTEQNNPPLMKLYKAIFPELNIPTNIISAAIEPNIIIVLAGFPPERKNPTINSNMNGAKFNKSSNGLPEMELANKITPKAANGMITFST